MISSNINEILLKNEFNLSSKETSNESFLDSIIKTKNNKIEEIGERTNDLSYENIKGITLEEIDSIFESNEDREMAKNLRLATLFTNDDYLAKALFNTVKGEPFTVGYSYLYDRYEDKHNFFASSSNSNNSLSELLFNSVSRKFEKSQNDNITDVIPQDFLNEILLEVNSFDFISALSTTSKDEYARYKNKDDDKYAFLYNDYNLKYQELEYKYNELKNYDTNLRNQF